MAHPWYATKLARKLRRRQTKAEAILWQELRGRKLNGIKFQRQFPIVYSYVGRAQFYIVDFYCHQYRAIIELDGSIHDHFKEHDRSRDECLKDMRYKTLRIPNKEVFEMDRLKGKILNFLLSG